MPIVELRLHTQNVQAMKNFYNKTLNIPLVAEKADSFALDIGDTVLWFEEVTNNNQGRYHIALNIPPQQFDAARVWLSERVTLLEHENEVVVTWQAWNAHALYFFDPAGNVIEFIARHNLPADAAPVFGGDTLLGVSEIGLATDDVGALRDKLMDEFAMPVFDAGDGTNFVAMGDERGLFIIVKRGRSWFPTTNVEADLSPTSITLTGVDGAPRDVEIAELPYRIRLE